MINSVLRDRLFIYIYVCGDIHMCIAITKINRYVRYSEGSADLIHMITRLYRASYSSSVFLRNIGCLTDHA